jgi:hypothetical protein
MIFWIFMLIAWNPMNYFTLNVSFIYFFIIIIYKFTKHKSFVLIDILIN